MDSQRREDFACLLAVLMLPSACSSGDGTMVSDSTSDGTMGSATSTSMGSTVTSADGSSGGTTTVDATEDTSTGTEATSSDELGPSSGLAESSGPADETTATETGAEIGPICAAFAQNLENCYPDEVDPAQVGVECEMAFDQYAAYGQDCLDAAEGWYMCRAEASCQELERDACFDWLNMVVGACE